MWHLVLLHQRRDREREYGSDSQQLDDRLHQVEDRMTSISRPSQLRPAVAPAADQSSHPFATGSRLRGGVRWHRCCSTTRPRWPSASFVAQREALKGPMLIGLIATTAVAGFRRQSTKCAQPSPVPTSIRSNIRLRVQRHHGSFDFRVHGTTPSRPYRDQTCGSEAPDLSETIVHLGGQKRPSPVRATSGKGEHRPSSATPPPRWAHSIATVSPSAAPLRGPYFSAPLTAPNFMRAKLPD